MWDFGLNLAIFLLNFQFYFLLILDFLGFLNFVVYFAHFGWNFLVLLLIILVVFIVINLAFGGLFFGIGIGRWGLFTGFERYRLAGFEGFWSLCRGRKRGLVDFGKGLCFFRGRVGLLLWGIAGLGLVGGRSLGFGKVFRDLGAKLALVWVFFGLFSLVFVFFLGFFGVFLEIFGFCWGIFELFLGNFLVFLVLIEKFVILLLILENFGLRRDFAGFWVLRWIYLGLWNTFLMIIGMILHFLGDIMEGIFYLFLVFLINMSLCDLKIWSICVCFLWNFRELFGIFAVIRKFSENLLAFLVVFQLNFLILVNFFIGFAN